MLPEGSLREEIIVHANDEYGVSPEYLWEGDFETAVLRHSDTKKWFAIIMNVKRSRLGLEGEGSADIMNVKCDPLLIDILVQRTGFMRAYHMNKQLWISVSLMGEVDKNEIFDLLNASYTMTKKKPKKSKKKKENNDA